MTFNFNTTSITGSDYSPNSQIENSPTGTKEIIKNGTYNVAQYANAYVNVPEIDPRGLWLYMRGDMNMYNGTKVTSNKYMQDLLTGNQTTYSYSNIGNWDGKFLAYTSWQKLKSLKTDEGTVICVFKASALGGSTQMAFLQNKLGNNGFRCFVSQTGLVHFAYSDGSAEYDTYLKNAGRITANIPVYIALTFSNAQHILKGYVNGAKTDEITLEHNIGKTTTSEAYIGGTCGAPVEGRYENMEIGYMQIYSRVLSESEITASYNQCKQIFSGI